MTKEIPLTQGKVALVDDDDYEELSKFKWCAVKIKKWYYAVHYSPQNNSQSHQLYMHAVIAGTPVGMHTDHINGNGLDNRRENLRVVTCRQNQQNQHVITTSKYPGVHWHKRYQKWQAQIWIEGKNRFLGYFDDENDAYHAYCGACAALGVPVLKWEK